MGNTQNRETSLLRDAVQCVEALLPDSWRATIASDGARFRVEPSSSTSAPDAVVMLAGPDGTTVSFAVESKPSGSAIRPAIAQLRAMSAALRMPPLFVSDYIGPTLRGALTDEGISYADATGWVRITAESPLILLTGQGAGRSPRHRESTAVVRLNGAAAGRLIRTLCAEKVPLGVRALAARADVSPGTVSKILPTLAAEGVIDRGERGVVTQVRRMPLIRRWVKDYSFLATNDAAQHFIAPRGLDRTLQKLEGLASPVTLTGSAAARRMLPSEAVPVVPLRLLALYAESPDRLAEDVRLIPAGPATANVVVAAPQDRSVLAEPLAPAPLVLADLLTLPGRSDAEAEQLVDALSLSDPAWRQ